MQDPLRSHLNRFVSLSDNEFAEVSNYFRQLSFKKKQDLHVAGKICPANFFVVKGCLRMFFINDKGIEQTIQFALENWWLSDYGSFSEQRSSEFTIQAVENAEILALDLNSQELLLKQHPVMERYFRIIHQRAHAASQRRISLLYNLSREDMYRNFVSLFPEFVQRIPQYLLASYLGITPEYLSELRRKRIS